MPWIVRSIWEEHVGWFRYESTTELYDVPPSAVWPDIVELAGGTATLLERARVTRRRRPPAAGAAPHRHRPGADAATAPHRRVKHAALEQLLTAAGGENHSEVQWLQQELNAAKADEEKQ